MSDQARCEQRERVHRAVDEMLDRVQSAKVTDARPFTGTAAVEVVVKQGGITAVKIRTEVFA